MREKLPIGIEFFEEACDMLAAAIANACGQLSYLADSPKIRSTDITTFQRLMSQSGSKTELWMSFAILMRMLHVYYGEQVILLIDEYDVPLDKANDHGYYDHMVGFLHVFFRRSS